MPVVVALVAAAAGTIALVSGLGLGGGKDATSEPPLGRRTPPATSAPAAPTVPPSTSVAPSTAPGPTIGTTPARLGAAPAEPTPAPVGLRIGRIGVDARVVPVGVMADQRMEVPPAREVGWYRFGPEPGRAGASVLAAHVDYAGVEGAFFRLRELGVGDSVEVVAADGTTTRFAVSRTERVPKTQLDDRYFDRSGAPRLVLITCGGSFDPAARSYRDNIVVTAEPVSPAGQ